LRILIDIGHPAHVHLFKNFAWEMQKKGNEIFFTCREKEFEVYLLNHYGFDYKSFGKKYESTFGKFIGLIEFDIKEFIQGMKFKPDLFLSHGSMYAAHAAFLMGRPHVSLEDTFNFEQVKLYKPFTKTILTSDYKHPLISEKVISYSGYHELAYLHPKYFKPDKNIFLELGIKKNTRFVILRLISWRATHYKRQGEILLNNVLKTISKLQEHARVFISSEIKLMPELDKYRIHIEPYKIHDALAYASLLFGESSTMASECAMLGTPSIYIDSKGTLLTKELSSKYELVFNYSESILDLQKAIEKSIEILKTENIKEKWQKRRNKMLSEKIDVTAFMVWFIENYPESFFIMKENPDYQFKFKINNIIVN